MLERQRRAHSVVYGARHCFWALEAYAEMSLHFEFELSGLAVQFPLCFNKRFKFKHTTTNILGVDKV